MNALPISVTLNYFALLREQRGVSQETLATHALTPRALYQELMSVHSFSLPVEKIGVAVNDRFTTLDHLLKDSDRVAFIPPVAGG